MPTMAETIVYVATEDDKKQLDSFVAKLFKDWVSFAMGQKDIRVGGKVAHKPIHPSGRYASSLSYAVQKTAQNWYKVRFMADSFLAPEAEAIEFGRKQVDLKKYMLGKDGRTTRLIPLRSVPSMVFTPPAYGPTRKRSSELKKSMASAAHNASPSGIFRVMTNTPGTWIMHPWVKGQKYREYDQFGNYSPGNVPVPFQPAHLLMARLQERYGH